MTEQWSRLPSLCTWGQCTCSRWCLGTLKCSSRCIHFLNDAQHVAQRMRKDSNIQAELDSRWSRLVNNAKRNEKENLDSFLTGTIEDSSWWSCNKLRTRYLVWDPVNFCPASPLRTLLSQSVRLLPSPLSLKTTPPPRTQKSVFCMLACELTKITVYAFMFMDLRGGRRGAGNLASCCVLCIHNCVLCIHNMST
jgi:hypothetical protein